MGLISSSIGPKNILPYSRLMKNSDEAGSGCGSVGRAVASDTRSLRFESRHRQIIILSNGPILAAFYFRLFHDIQFNKLMTAQMVCLGLKPGVEEQKLQTNSLSYGGTPKHRQIIIQKINLHIARCIEKTKIKKKRPGNAHFIKKNEEGSRNSSSCNNSNNNMNNNNHLNQNVLFVYNGSCLHTSKQVPPRGLL